MSNIIITGATGVLGKKLIERYSASGNIHVIAVLGRSLEKATTLPQCDNLQIITLDELYYSNFGHVDAIIHTAFSRGEDYPGLSKSIEMTRRIIQYTNRMDVDLFINISSQGIYRSVNPGKAVSEDGDIEPNTAYGLTKWSVENMVAVGCKKSYVNIRMSSLSSNARFMAFFANKVKLKEDIVVTAPNQYASIMDVSDAVEGIYQICQIPKELRHSEYNLGPGVQYSIKEFAELAVEVGADLGYSSSKVLIDDNGSTFSILMDCQRLIGQTGWTPKVDVRKMYEIIYNR